MLCINFASCLKFGVQSVERARFVAAQAQITTYLALQNEFAALSSGVVYEGNTWDG